MTAIVNPVRKMLRRAQFIASDVVAIKLEKKRVAVSHSLHPHEHALNYDHLVLALGSVTNLWAYGRIITQLTFELEDWPGVWALGDCASVPDGKGGFHPPTAQHALRQAKTLARNVAAAINGTRKKDFSFSTIGQLAAISHRVGVARIFGIQFSGFLAWWMCRTIYLSKLPHREKRVHVALGWTFDLLFSKDTVQCVSFRAAASEMPSSGSGSVSDPAAAGPSPVKQA